MQENYICPRCGNRKPESIGLRNGVPYCRLCLPFQGKEAQSSFEIKKNVSLKLEYPLSEKQATVAKKVKESLEEGKNVLIHAVTGAGKTELVYSSMEMYLKKGLHVGFATPRKDVVVDLLPRIQEAFPEAKVVSVYGEHATILNGDIITLTTHQLYRYPNYFDLLILDEIDAFPYRDNEVLNSFFYRSVKGNYVLLSATPSKEDIHRIENDNGVVVTLFERYHHSPLPTPEYVKTTPVSAYVKCLWLLREFMKKDQPVFVFVPTIEIGKKLYAFLSSFLFGGAFVSSQEEARRLNIERFKNQELRYLVTTSILERGVTVRNLQVIVFAADHAIYNQATLVQIAGRVGRKIGATNGKVYFLGQENNVMIQEAIREITGYNRQAGLL